MQRKWVKAYVAYLDGKSLVCPRCGAEAFLRLVGDPETRIGFGMMWCSACDARGHLCRVEIPDTETFFAFDDPKAMDGVPDPWLVES